MTGRFASLKPRRQRKNDTPAPNRASAWRRSVFSLKMQRKCLQCLVFSANIIFCEACALGDPRGSLIVRKNVLPRDLISPAVNKEALEAGKKLLPAAPGKAQRKRVCTGKGGRSFWIRSFREFSKKGSRKRSGKKLLPAARAKPSVSGFAREKEEGAFGYAVFASFRRKARGNEVEKASSDVVKGRGQSCIGMEPHRENRGQINKSR